MKINSKSIFFLTFAFIILIGFLIINENTTTKIYDLTFSNIYIFLIFLFLAIAIIIVLFKEKIEDKKQKIFRFLSYIVFAPMVLYPIFRCYLKIPYIFCHVCPRKCIFGHLRPYTVPAVLLLNLDKGAWCYKYCPVGKLQDKQVSIKTKKIVLPKFLFYTKYLFLLFVIISYFMISGYNKNPISLAFYNYFFKNIFSVSIIVLIIVILLFILSFFIHRFWCNYICPIGTVSEDILKAENKMKKIEGSSPT